MYSQEPNTTTLSPGKTGRAEYEKKRVQPMGISWGAHCLFLDCKAQWVNRRCSLEAQSTDKTEECGKFLRHWSLGPTSSHCHSPLSVLRLREHSTHSSFLPCCDCNSYKGPHIQTGCSSSLSALILTNSAIWDPFPPSPLQPDFSFTWMEGACVGPSSSTMI